MTKLPLVSSREVVRALRKAGYLDAPKRGKGSHVALVKHESGQTRIVIVPEKATLPKGTLKAILDQAGLTKNQFIELLKK